MIKRLVIMAESMGIFFLSNSSVRVSLVSFSLSP